MMVVRKEDTIQKLIEILNPLIGYELSAANEDLIVKTTDFVCQSLKFSLEDSQEIKDVIIQLFRISIYSDYLLIRNESLVDVQILSLGKTYFNYLHAKENKSFTFFKNSFLEILDRSVILGEPQAIRLKAYINLTGVFYPAAVDSAIVLLQKMVLFGDFFSLKILEVLDEKNSTAITQLADCIKSVLLEPKSESQLNKLFSKDVRQLTNIVLLAAKSQLESRIINHRLYDYLKSTTDSYEEKISKIRRQYFEVTKIKKVGY